MEVGLNKPNTSELNNADLNIINKNIIISTPFNFIKLCEKRCKNGLL